MAQTLELARPVEHEGRTYSSVVVDEPTVGAVEAYTKAAAEGGEMAGMIAMLAYDLEWPEAAVRKIRKSDFERISEAFAPFGEATQPAGGPSS